MERGGGGEGEDSSGNTDLIKYKLWLDDVLNNLTDIAEFRS